MTSYHTFVKNIGIISWANLLLFLERIILLPVITKLLGAENYGIWTQLGVTISFVSPLVILGLNGAVVRFLAGEKTEKEVQEGVYSVLTIVFVATSIIALLLIIFNEPVANFFQTPPILIKLLSFIIIFECLNSILLSILQAFQEIKKYSFFLILKTLGEVGLVVTALSLGHELLGAVVSLLAIRVVIFLILFGLLLKRVRIKIPDFSRIKGYLAFGLPRVASSISYWVLTSSDRYLIVYFMGVLFVGYYSPAYTIGNLINFFIYPFFFMLPPVLSKLFDENKIYEVKTYLKYSLKYFLLISIPATFGLSILSQELLTIFSTEEIALNSYYVTPFIVLSILFYGIGSFFDQILLLAKKTRIAGTIWIMAALVNLGLNFLFIPRFGILGAALTTLLAYLLSFLLTWYFSSKDLQFDVDWGFVGKSIFASLLMISAIIWFNPAGIFRTLIAIFMGVIIYGILIFLLKGLTKKETEFFKDFLKR